MNRQIANQTHQQKPTATPAASGLLQRKCACGNHTMGGGECSACSNSKRLGLQTKLKINEPGDIYEQEADRIADQVLATPAHSAVSGVPPRIQRFSGQSNGLDTAPASVDRVLASSGRPLEPALRQNMEQRFGHDFSRVRVHDSAAAEKSAREVNAHAYTVGKDVVFGAGRFAPGTHEGRRLMAHELTHAMQQGFDADARRGDITLGDAQDGHEREAAARSTGAGHGSARVERSAAQPVLQRQPAPPKEEANKKLGQKEVTTQPPPMKVPAPEAEQKDKPVPKQEGKPEEKEEEEEKEGVKATTSLGVETGIKREERKTKTEVAGKLSADLEIPITDKLKAGLGVEAGINREEGKTKREVAGKASFAVEIPITDKLKAGPITFLKGAGAEASFGVKSGESGPVTSLELETTVKMISLELPKVTNSLFTAEFGISGSALAGAEVDLRTGTRAGKVGFAGEAEAKLKRTEKSPFFITVTGSVEKTRGKEGDAEFKWGPTTWKAGASVGVEFP